MRRFVVGDDRSQSTLFPERLDDYLGEDNPVRAVDCITNRSHASFNGNTPNEFATRPNRGQPQNRCPYKRRQAGSLSRYLTSIE
jgi:hypothetical protein